MTSEWEELEALTKDELIIELMKERYERRETNRQLRAIIDYDRPAGQEPSGGTGEDDYLLPGYRTSEAWARKIMLYARKCYQGQEFSPAESAAYGLNWDQADEVFDRLAEEKKFDWPSDDPRSGRFSGITGMYTAEVAALDPAERRRMLKEEQENADALRNDARQQD